MVTQIVKYDQVDESASFPRAIGPRLDHPAILDLLSRWPSPADLRAAGEKRIATRMLKLAPRKGRDWAHEIVAALGEQTVVVTGTNAAALVIPRLAAQLTTLRRQRDEVAAEVERLVDAHPLQPVLTSMPGVGVRTAARLLTEVAGKHFPTAGHLAAYAGLAPVTRRSGSSIRGEYSSRRGNRVLKNTMFLSAFAALRDPDSRAYYDRKISQANGTTKPCLLSRDADQTCSTPCSATAPSTSGQLINWPHENNS